MRKFLYKAVKALAVSFGRIVPDKIYISLRYWVVFHRKIDWMNPKSFSEKLQWLKVYNNQPNYSRLVDKIEVKDIVAEKIGESHIIPTLFECDDVKKIKFELLPDIFVAKCSHDSGSIQICNKNNPIGLKESMISLKKSLRHSSYLAGRELVYKNVPHRILVEPFIVDNSGYELKDYKFFSFDGTVRFFKIDFNRFTDHKANYYDLDMNLLPFEEELIPSDPTQKFEKPQSFNDMVRFAEILSAGIPFVRIDFYEVENKALFGEMTFFPACGFERIVPYEWDIKIGSWLNIEKLR